MGMSIRLLLNKVHTFQAALTKWKDVLRIRRGLVGSEVEGVMNFALSDRRLSLNQHLILLDSHLTYCETIKGFFSSVLNSFKFLIVFNP